MILAALGNLPKERDWNFWKLRIWFPPRRRSVSVWAASETSSTANCMGGRRTWRGRWCFRKAETAAPSIATVRSLAGRLGFVRHSPMDLQKEFLSRNGLLGVLAFYGLFRFLVEFVREPDAQLGLDLGPFTRGQELTFPMLLLGAVMMIIYARRRPQASASEA